MARLMNGEPSTACKALRELIGQPGMCSTSLLWMVLIEAHDGDAAVSSKILSLCAQGMVDASGRHSVAANMTNADDQTLYDAGVAALAEGDPATAQRFLTQVQQTSDTSDAAVWVALITATHDWQSARNQLTTACETGAPESRGLAHQLFSVICAMENRPESMIQHTLAGQRLLSRASNSRQPVDMPPREEVWKSDDIKQ
jgi:hypothetical protein